MSDEQSTFRQWWRVAVLVILVCTSTVFIFGLGPGASATPDAAQPTNQAADSDRLTELTYGLDLAGGTRLRAPLIGVTAEDVSLPPGDHSELEREIASQIESASATDVIIRTHTSQNSATRTTVELTTDSPSPNTLASALNTTNATYESIRHGVTRDTRSEAVTIIEDKLNQDGLGGATVRQVSSASGENFILIEVPNRNRESVREVLDQRGVVQIDIYHPTQNGYETRKAVLTRDDFQRVGSAQRSERNGPHVPVVLNSEAASNFENITRETGLVPSGSRCLYEQAPQQSDGCLLTRVDGEVVYSAGMSPSLAENIGSGEWKHDGSFILQTTNYSEASELSLHLRAGSLPASLNFTAGTSTYISPTQGDHFRTSSLLISLLAVLAVAGKVFYRYRDIRVAAPMVAVALSEVVILLGFAAAVNYPIGLAVVGGLIAVIGTGVDDLIIIANEVLSTNGVSSSRVFQTRFKKAFWVIMAAAVTTIIAMSPLVILSLGDLRGFAIFTIVGVIIGATITRPAYGDVLEHLLLD